MKMKWEECRFFSSSGSLTKEYESLRLPFQIGAVTKHGVEHQNKGISNQDAVHMVIKPGYIVGVLSDGCTSNHPSIMQDFSLNQTGATLLAHIVGYTCESLVKHRKHRIKPEVFLSELSKQVINRLIRLHKTITLNQIDQIAFARNLLSSTTLGFVIREKDYLVFHWGDGLLIHNGQYKSLQESAGYYSSDCFFERSDLNSKGFKSLIHGNTDELSSLCIATDGFANPDVLKHKKILSLITKQTTTKGYGYQNIIPEFHLGFLEKILQNDSLVNWPEDDASLILLRRT